MSAGFLLALRLPPGVDFADNLDRFGDLFRDSDFVIIPRVYREVTTTRVLVMQFFEGFHVTEVDEILRHKVDTQRMIENLVHANVLAMDRYFSGFMKVLYGDVEPVEAIGLVEEEADEPPAEGTDGE